MSVALVEDVQHGPVDDFVFRIGYGYRLDVHTLSSFAFSSFFVYSSIRLGSSIATAVSLYTRGGRLSFVLFFLRVEVWM